MRFGSTIVSVSQRLRTKWRRADGGGGRRLRDPREGKGRELGCPATASAHLTAPEGRVGPGTRARTVLLEEPPDAVALGGGTRTALWRGRGGPFLMGAEPAQAAPVLTARASGGEGASRRE